MNDSVFSWLVVLEFVLPFFLLSVVLLVIIIRGQSRYKEAMRELIITVKENEPDQIIALKKFLIEKANLEEDVANKYTKAIIKERKFFFRTFVSAILNKDVESLAFLDEELTRITDRYHRIPIAAVAEVSAPSIIESVTGDDAMNNQINELNDEVTHLKKDVEITLSTLNNIFGEYSSMFGEESSSKNMSVEEILEAMEGFSKQNKTAAAEEEGIKPPKMKSGAQDEDIIVTGVANEAELAKADVEKEMALRLDGDTISEADLAALDNMELEDVEEDIEEEEPSWEDAFSELKEDEK